MHLKISDCNTPFFISLESKQANNSPDEREANGALVTMLPYLKPG